MPNLVLALEVDRVDLVDDGANSAAFIRLYKRKESTSDMELNEILAKMAPEHAEIIKGELAKAKSEVPAETQTQLDEAVAKAAKADEAKATAEAELAAAKTELEEVAKSKKPEEPDFEEVLKSMDPAVQTYFKSVKLKADAAEEQLRQVAAKQIEDEAVAKARELKSLPVEEAKLVEMFKSAPAGVFEILKAANEAIDNAGTFEETGVSKRKDNGDSKAAWEAFEKKTKDIAARDGITVEKATGVAMKEHPDLYRAYLDGGAN